MHKPDQETASHLTTKVTYKLSLLQGTRDESEIVDEGLAEQDAVALFEVWVGLKRCESLIFSMQT